MCGDDPKVFAEVEPILQVMGGRVAHLGDVGASQVTEAINQVILDITIQAVAEGITLARKSGARSVMPSAADTPDRWNLSAMPYA